MSAQDNGGSRSQLSAALAGVLALAAAMGIGRFVYTPILPAMVEDLSLARSQAGFIASANFIGYLFGAIAAASPRLPGAQRSWLLVGLVANAGFAALMAAPSSIALLALVRFGAGIASAFALVFSSSLVLARLAQAGRTDLSALPFAGIGSGILTSSAIVSLLAHLDWSWRWQWLACAAASAAAIPLVRLWLPALPGPQETRGRQSGTKLDPRLMRLIIAYGLFGFGYVITATFLVDIVRANPLTRPVEPFIWAAVGLAAIPSVWGWNSVAARMGNGPAYALACLVEAAGVALSVFAGGEAGVLIAAACLGGTFVGITALGLIGARSLTSGDPRRVLAMMTAAFGLGQVAGPIVAGAAFDLTGSYTLPTLAAAAALVLAAPLALREEPAASG